MNETQEQKAKRGVYAARYRALHREALRARARAWREANRDKVIETRRRAKKAYKERHPDQTRAHAYVKRALKSGELKVGYCACANERCKGKIEAHHSDYSRPGDVMWLCREHHVAWHRFFAPEPMLVLPPLFTEKRREVARRNMLAINASGKGHRFTSETAAIAGSKGGKNKSKRS